MDFEAILSAYALSIIDASLEHEMGANLLQRDNIQMDNYSAYLDKQMSDLHFDKAEKRERQMLAFRARLLKMYNEAHQAAWGNE